MNVGTSTIFNLQHKLDNCDIHISHTILWWGMEHFYKTFHVVSKTLILKLFDPPSKPQKATIE